MSERGCPPVSGVTRFSQASAATGRRGVTRDAARPLGALGQPHAGSAARRRRPLLCVKPLFAPRPAPCQALPFVAARPFSRRPAPVPTFPEPWSRQKNAMALPAKGGRGATRIAHKRDAQTRASSASIAASTPATAATTLAAQRVLWSQCSSEQRSAVPHSHTRATR